jgi:formamidopyrimidine-DNA glycosylase
MPEGPEVRVVCDKILERSSQLIFDKIEVIENVPAIKHRFSNHLIQNLEKIRNFKIQTVETYGKLIFFILQVEDQKFYVMNTLGMTGTWSWNASSHKYARLNFFGKDNLTFIDMRNFGSFKIVDYPTYIRKRLTIGYDLLKHIVRPEVWKNFQFCKSICDLALGEALLKQYPFSGIGNIYKSEIIYESCLDPRIIVKKIPKNRWSQINLIAHEVLKKAYEAGGTTIRDFEADGKKGNNQFQLKIFGREQVPEGIVKKIVQNGRTTYYCPQRIK